MNKSFKVSQTIWERDATALLSVRSTVFVKEQKVPQKIEVDEFDPVSLHFIARDSNDHPIGTARLLPDGHIGRVAVLKEWRRNGVGLALMQAALASARKQLMNRVDLHAQVSSIAFYSGLGFQVVGPEFEEAGIPHRKMSLLLLA